MPWLEERTLTLFVRDTEVRRYEPGVRERGVDVERARGPLVVGPADPDAHRALPLKSPVVHCHLIGQHNPTTLSAPPSSLYPHFLCLYAQTYVPLQTVQGEELKKKITPNNHWFSLLIAVSTVRVHVGVAVRQPHRPHSRLHCAPAPGHSLLQRGHT